MEKVETKNKELKELLSVEDEKQFRQQLLILLERTTVEIEKQAKTLKNALYDDKNSL